MRALLSLLLVGCGTAPVAVGGRVAVVDVGSELGTSYHVTVVADDVVQARRDLAAVRGRCREFDQRWSEWNDASDLARVNREAARGGATVDAELARLLRGALHVAEATGGAFDPTWPPLKAVWDRAARRATWPAAVEVRAALDAVGWRKVQVDGEAVSFAQAGVQLGIAGFAKGWIIDALFLDLRERGYTDVRVNIGGDVRTSGRDADGEAWTLDIVDPFELGRVARRIVVGDTSAATSGNYLRFGAVAGRRVGHILDPRTGYPPRFDGSVTVLTRDAAMADALATALFVLGPERGIEFVRGVDGVEALFVTRDGVETTLASR